MENEKPENQDPSTAKKFFASILIWSIIAGIFFFSHTHQRTDSGKKAASAAATENHVVSESVSIKNIPLLCKRIKEEILMQKQKAAAAARARKKMSQTAVNAKPKRSSKNVFSTPQKTAEKRMVAARAATPQKTVEKSTVAAGSAISVQTAGLSERTVTSKASANSGKMPKTEPAPSGIKAEKISADHVTKPEPAVRIPPASLPPSSFPKDTTPRPIQQASPVKKPQPRKDAEQNSQIALLLDGLGYFRQKQLFQLLNYRLMNRADIIERLKYSKRNPRLTPGYLSHHTAKENTETEKKLLMLFDAAHYPDMDASKIKERQSYWRKQRGPVLETQQKMLKTDPWMQAAAIDGFIRKAVNELIKRDRFSAEDEKHLNVFLNLRKKLIEAAQSEI